MQATHEDEVLGEVVGIRAQLRSNPHALLDLRAAISSVLASHGINSSAVKDEIIICVEGELNNSLNQVTLPGGTNCAQV